MCASFESIFVLSDTSPSTTNFGWPLCEGPCGNPNFPGCPCSAGFTNPWYIPPTFVYMYGCALALPCMTRSYLASLIRARYSYVHNPEATPDMISTCTISSGNYKGAAIMGGIVYRGTMFPAAYQGVYFFADSSQSTLSYLNIDSNKKPVLFLHTQTPRHPETMHIHTEQTKTHKFKHTHAITQARKHLHIS